MILLICARLLKNRPVFHVIFSRSIAIKFCSQFIDMSFYDQPRRSSATFTEVPRALTPSPTQCPSPVIRFLAFLLARSRGLINSSSSSIQHRPCSFIWSLENQFAVVWVFVFFCALFFLPFFFHFIYQLT